MYEFLVDSISPHGLVLGRNGDSNIPVGTTFTAVRRSRVHNEPGGFGTEDLGQVRTVALTLRKVHCYQRTIEYLPGGYTAGLEVTGDGMTLLEELLRELPPCNYLTLAAPESRDA